MKRLAILNFHPAFTPPRSGGELRYWNLATRLSESFDVHMVNPTYGEAEREIVEHTPTCKEVRLPKTRAYNRWHRFFDRMARFPECSALVATLACKRHAAFREEARRAAEGAEVLMLSSPFMAPAAPKPATNQLLVYDSYNVESTLHREALGDGLWGRWGTSRIARIEGHLARRADLVLVCSREDGEEMADLYGIDESKIVLVPNGVDAGAVRPSAGESERLAARERLGLEEDRAALLFIGSYHPPNIEAARFLVEEIAPHIEKADLLIAGKVCEALKGSETPRNVRLLGLVEEDTKRDLLGGCEIALNPMFSGSGTNLKMLEFLASGLPVVTTPKGARGLEIEHGDHAMVVEKSHFLRCVLDVLADERRRLRLRRLSRQHAETHFHWPVLADRLRHVLDIKTSRRLLMLNDYPVSPVRSGGQVRLEAVARHLSETVAPVTILTLCKKKRGRHVLHGPRCEELNVARSGLHNAIDKLLAGWMTVAVDDVSALVFWRASPRLKRALKRELRLADAILLDHIYMTNVARRLRGRRPIVYESHNAETVLKRALFGSGMLGDFLVRATERAERRALREAAFTACVSEGDAEIFRSQFGADVGRLVLAGNGVDCAARAVVPVDQRPALREAVELGPEPTFLFLGSGHPPNRDGIEFLIRTIAPENPGCTFLVAGSVCGWFHGRRVPSNVVMLGPISEDTKEFLLQCADLALNPVFDGSGSSLKVPEYLSAGLPVISSRVGARGFADEERPEVRLAGRDNLSRLVADGAADLEWRRRASAGGRRLAEERFDWSVTLRPLSDGVRGLLAENSWPGSAVPR